MKKAFGKREHKKIFDEKNKNCQNEKERENMSVEVYKKEAYLIDQKASSELQKYVRNEQTMFETLQKIGDLDLSFDEWRFVYDEAGGVLDKKSFKLFRGVALEKMLEVAKNYFECSVVLGLAGKNEKMKKEVLEKMKKIPKSEDEKQEMENLLM